MREAVRRQMMGVPSFLLRCTSAVKVFCLSSEL
ncbi:MAG: hypothetical protein A4E67_00590 [Syntrophaceae bacterium PtaB.Bin038]|nr:MAG: hypothetical protein A4E67_00590 [Syntrophaceae bacterium PtaB.Bin038]